MPGSYRSNATLFTPRLQPAIIVGRSHITEAPHIAQPKSHKVRTTSAFDYAFDYVLSLQSSGQADSERAAHAMADPEIQMILTDPVVRQVLTDFKENPQHAQKVIRLAEPWLPLTFSTWEYLRYWCPCRKVLSH